MDFENHSFLNSEKCKLENYEKVMFTPKLTGANLGKKNYEIMIY